MQALGRQAGAGQASAAHLQSQQLAGLVAAALPRLNQRIALLGAAPASTISASARVAVPSQPQPICALLQWAAGAALTLCSGGGDAAEQLVALALRVRFAGLTGETVAHLGVQAIFSFGIIGNDCLRCRSYAGVLVSVAGGGLRSR